MFSDPVLSAAATERVRPANNIAAAGILTPIIIASTVGSEN